jgi:hypothetical protein
MWPIRILYECYDHLLHLICLSQQDKGENSLDGGKCFVAHFSSRTSIFVPHAKSIIIQYNPRILFGTFIPYFPLKASFSSSTRTSKKDLSKKPTKYSVLVFRIQLGIFLLKLPDCRSNFDLWSIRISGKPNCISLNYCERKYDYDNNYWEYLPHIIRELLWSPTVKQKTSWRRQGMWTFWSSMYMVGQNAFGYI